MAEHGFYDAGPLKQVAINLFYGWGYNFYRRENQLRADDQLVLAKAAWLLSGAKASVDAAEAARRRTFPAPTRANPFPDPAAVAQVQALERLAGRIGALAASLHTLPTPENDRMTQRYREEAATLERLVDSDQQLIGQCDLLRSMLEGLDGAAILERMAQVEVGLGAISETLRQRQVILL